MRKLTHNHKAEPKLTFFQNYQHHINSVAHKLQTKYPELAKMDTIEGIANAVGKVSLDGLNKEVLARLRVLDSLYDGHDYMDEVVGATALPLIGCGVAICLAGLAIWEGAQALAIAAGRMDKTDDTDHTAQALNALVLAAAAILISVAWLIKSVISLVSRPIVTAVNGCKPSVEDRFTDLQSTQAVTEAFLGLKP